MTTGPGTVDRPLHPLEQMTTSELSRYRHYLERAISQLSQDAQGARADLQTRLGDVLAEEDDRRRIRAGIA